MPHRRQGMRSGRRGADTRYDDPLLVVRYREWISERREMMNAKTLVHGHPLIAYFFLAYTIPWLGSLAAVGPKMLRGEEMLPTDSLPVLLLMLAGPSIAGITMTAVMDGKADLRDLFARMGKWRVGARWYAALLIPPVLILLVLYVLGDAVSPPSSRQAVPGHSASWPGCWPAFFWDRLDGLRLSTDACSPQHAGGGPVPRLDPHGLAPDGRLSRSPQRPTACSGCPIS